MDAEYFSRTHLVTAQLLGEKKAKPLGNFGTPIASAFYPAATHLYSEKGIPFARCVDVIEHPVITPLQDRKFERLPPTFIDASGQIQSATSGDLIISKVGTPCYASVIAGYEKIALSRTVLGLIDISEIDPYYLMVFLRSCYGFSQLMRERELTIQHQLTLERVRRVLVYKATKSFQHRVRTLTQKYLRYLEFAETRGRDARHLLTISLGLVDWRPPEWLTYIRSASNAVAAGRLDAEHFKEKYAAAEQALESAGAKAMVPLVTFLTALTNGHTPLYHNLTEGDVAFICAEHVDDFEVNLNSDKRILTDHHRGELARTALHEGDVLMTIKGRIGNVAIVENLPKAANINQDVALLRFGTESPPLWYVVAYLNSFFGRLQMEQLSTGAINPFLGLFNVKRIRIPVFDEMTMEAIGDETRGHVMSARDARREARRFLDSAKRAVEIAIEQSEEAAVRYLEEVGN